MQKDKTVLERLGDFFGSYALACVLLALLFLLTFLGTIEQTEHGLYEVQKKYFESLFLVHDLGGVVPIPLPGVYLVLIFLGINLVTGGIIRMRKSSRTLGVLVIHTGILVMLAAGFVKLKFSNDGNLMLYEGDRSDEYQSYFEWEVVVWRAGDSTEFLIPEEDFADLHGEKTRAFESPDLPFKLVLSHFERNGSVLPKGPMWQATNPVIDGFSLLRHELSKEAEQNVTGLYVHVEDKQGQNAKDGIVWGFDRYPFAWTNAGATWAFDVRKKRFKMPFAVHLDRFTRELYPGTQTAKSFMSDVTNVDKSGIDQKVRIQMNEPLRRDGLVLFQASWGPENAKPGEKLFSVFAVVHNPSDQWPLISCIIIGVGMLITFTQKLARYMKAQAAERSVTT